MPPTFRPAGQASRRERKREHDTKRRREKPWRRWYGLAVWKRIRAAQLTAQPWCELCLERGETVAATVVNHVVPHRGIWSLFVSGPFQSLCAPCHDGEVQRRERKEAEAAKGRGESKSGG